MQVSGWLVGLLVCGLVGCATTGDPRQGGLFGWREAQAQQRLQQFETQAEQAQAQQHEAGMHSHELTAHKVELTKDVDQLRDRLISLQAENERLYDQLLTLGKQTNLNQTELDALYITLQENEKIRRQLDTQQPQANHMVQIMENQNQKLHRDILFLMRY